MMLCAEPACTVPQTRLTPARGSSRRESTAGSSVINLPSAKVRSSGQVRARSVPPNAGDAHLDRVGSTGQRPFAQPDLAYIQTRVAVQTEDPDRVVEHTLFNRLQRSAWHDLFGWLKDQPHSVLGMRVGQSQTSTHQGGGVHIVTAGMRHTRHRRPPRVRGGVIDRKGVEICTEYDGRARFLGPISATRPVLRSRRTRNPAVLSRSTKVSVVRCSAHDNSGWACRSRRRSIRVSVCRPTAASRGAKIREGVEHSRACYSS